MPTPPIDPVFEGLARALALHERRREVPAASPAYVEAPGLRARETDFGAALARAFERAAPAEPGREASPDGAPAPADGNTMDADLRRDDAGPALARLLGKRIALMRLAIDGGK